MTKMSLLQVVVSGEIDIEPLLFQCLLALCCCVYSSRGTSGGTAKPVPPLAEIDRIRIREGFIAKYVTQGICLGGWCIHRPKHIYFFLR